MYHNCLYVLGREKEMSDGYVYTVNNKQGKAVDFWVMDKPKPNEASVIFSCRFSRYVKPKSKPIMDLIDDALIKGGTE